MDRETMMKWEQFAPIGELTDDKWVSWMKGPDITLPIAPFPGLCVGSLTVDKVLVHQGHEDNKRGQLQYESIDDQHAAILEYNGWLRNEP